MKKLVNVVALVCVLAMLISGSVNVNALEVSSEDVLLEAEVNALLESNSPENHLAALKLLEENGGEVQKDVYNEYDAYLEAKQMLESAPMLFNEESDEYDDLYTYVETFEENFAEKIAYLNTLTDDQLRFVNYRDDQISAIRNYDGSDEMMRASASQCYVYGGFTNFKSTSSKTSVKLIAAFEWDGLYSYGSFFTTKDIFGVTWNSPFAFNANSAEAYISYKNVNYGTTTSATYTPTQRGLYACEAVFDKSKMQYVGNNPVSHLVDGGSVICNLDTYTRETQVMGYAEYGKSVSDVTPGISGTPDGVGLSISFNEGIKYGGSAGFRYPD